MTPMKLVLILALAVVACAAPQGAALKPAVEGYHKALRWNRIQSAARYRVPEERGRFVARYTAAEDDLRIESIEVIAVNVLPNTEPPQAEVVVSAKAYLLPSTILRKIIITEQWQQTGNAWMLTSTDRELAPEPERSTKGDTTDEDR